MNLRNETENKRNSGRTENESLKHRGSENEGAKDSQLRMPNQCWLIKLRFEFGVLYILQDFVISLAICPLTVLALCTSVSVSLAL